MSNEIIKKHNSELSTKVASLIGSFSQLPEPQQIRQIVSIERDLDLNKTIGMPPVYHLQKTGKQDLLLIVERALKITALMFKYAEKMQDLQISIMANDLLDRFSHNSVEDIILMLRYARQGKLGSTRSVLDNDTLFNTLVPRYLDMKAEVLEELNKPPKQPETPLNMSEEDRKRQREMVDKLHSAWVANRKKKEVPEYEVVDYPRQFVEQLPGLVGRLSTKELQTEMNRAKHSKALEAYEIYKAELERRGFKL